MNTPKVLHIDIEKGWRGGQNQSLNLYVNEIEKGLNPHFICLENSDVQKVLIQNNLPFTAINYKNELDVISAYKISRLIKKNNFNIINCHSSHSLSLGLLSKYFYSAPKVIGIRRVDFKIKNNYFSSWKYKSKNLDALVCVSEAIKNIMEKTISNYNKLYVIHDGIDTQKYVNIDSLKLKQELNLNGKIIIGTIAAFVGHKDYPTLLRTIKIISEIRKDIVFIALGDGPLFNDMKQLASDLNIENHIIFAGFRNNVGEYLNLFDIFIMTSNEEGLGSSLLDAMSVGLPIIATKAGGIPEIVENDYNGILCNIADSHSLANAIIKLVNNIELRNIYSNNSKKKVEAFSIENTAKKYLILYHKLLNLNS